MRIGVLGTTVAVDGADGADSAVALGGPKQRALLAALALHHGRAVSPDTLADLVWDGSPPPGVQGTLQGYVAGLRRALEPSRTTRGGGTLLVTEPPGYALRVGAADLDATAFEAAVTAVHETVGPLADALCRGLVAAGAPAAGVLEDLDQRLDMALRRWRGTAYADLGDVPAASAERARLDELRVLATEDRATLGLLLGRPGPVAARLEAFTREHPLRERAWALRAVALARSGRQADALAVLRDLRELLDEELGLEPGPEVRAVQEAVLRQSVSPAPAPAATSPVTVPVTVPAPRVAAAAPLPFPTPWEWSLTGRDPQLAALTGLVDAVVSGSSTAPAFVALTGDPGIGKSRLAIETATHAAGRGMVVAWGRCSQDDGAPALWPWATVLERLGADLPVDLADPRGVDGADDTGAAFRTWERIVETVLAAAARQPVLLVLDDLHWADESSLRVLRLLTEAAAVEGTGPRLLTVTTWRDHPAPTGPLAEVAEALARKHALRVALEGLPTEAVARLVREVAGADPTEGDVAALWQRTEGNPFFLVEYARLARDRGDLTSLLAEPEPPAAVHEVLARRIGALPVPTGDLLRTASVLGRIFDLGTLARTAGAAEDDVLDRLDPALVAGLVDEDAVDRFRFTHALVRDTVLAGLPVSRRARVHRRAAEALADRPGHEAEVAWHWLGAGPQHAGSAWRAARTAAGTALDVHAHAEARDLLQHALRAHAEDPQATPPDRFSLLLDLAEVQRRAGRWTELREVAHEAVALADRLGDVDLLVEAAVLTSAGALWQSAARAEVDPILVDALRRALDRLPDGDDPRRCRVMLALAGEVYYGASPREREALAGEAVAMARRLEDPVLQATACLGGAIGVWRAETAELRRDLCAEAAGLARRLGDDTTLASALTLHAVAAGELGDLESMDRSRVEARALADRLHHVYAELVLDSLDASWLSMRGDFDGVLQVLGHMRAIGELVSISGYEEAAAGAMLMLLLWQGRDEELAAGTLAMDGTTFLPLSTSVLAMLCRAGRVEEARAYLAEHRAEVAAAMELDTWYSPMAWSMAAEAACGLGDPALAAAAYARLAPLSGRPACAGSGTAAGPVDMFLALAAHATGEAALATRHADLALERCRAWEVPLAADWVRRERERWGI